MNKKQSLEFHTIYRPEPEGGFTAIVPSLPGCVSYGETFEEAQEMITDAIHAYLVSLKKHREPIPKDQNALFTKTTITGIQYA